MQKTVLSVVAGQTREVVGSIQAKVGMLTNRGVITRISQAGTIFVGTKQFRRPSDQLKVRHTEALKHGYPNSVGSHRIFVRNIKRNGTTIAA